MATKRRMIDGAFWLSEKVASLSYERRFLFIGLITNADDQGRMKAHPSLIRSAVFPYDDIPLRTISSALAGIAKIGGIKLYEVDGTQYLQIIKWWDYQRPRWAWPSSFPAPPGWTDRMKYRRGNDVIRSNWGGVPTVVDEPPAQPDPIVEPERNQSGTDAESAPRTSGMNSGLSTNNDRIDSGASAPPDPPPKKRRRRAKPKTPTPAAVSAFRKAAHRYPARSWYDDVAETVGEDPVNLAFWESVVKEWVGLGFNPTNVKGMLDCYRKRELPGKGRASSDPMADYNAMAQIEGWE